MWQCNVTWRDLCAAIGSHRPSIVLVTCTVDLWREISIIVVLCLPLVRRLFMVTVRTECRTTVLPKVLKWSVGLLKSIRLVPCRNIWVKLTCRCLFLDRWLFSLFIRALRLLGKELTRLSMEVPVRVRCKWVLRLLDVVIRMVLFLVDRVVNCRRWELMAPVFILLPFVIPVVLIPDLGKVTSKPLWTELLNRRALRSTTIRTCWWVRILILGSGALDNAIRLCRGL